MRNILNKIIGGFLAHPAWGGVGVLIATIALIYTMVSYHGKNEPQNLVTKLVRSEIDKVENTTAKCPQAGSWKFHEVRMNGGWRLCEIEVKEKQNLYLLSLKEGCDFKGAPSNEFNIASFYCVNTDGYLKYRNIDVLVNSRNAFLSIRPGGWTGHGKLE